MYLCHTISGPRIIKASDIAKIGPEINRLS
jgi:hypothetical protein